MNKQERTEIKKKGRKMYWIAYLMGFGAVGLLILFFTVDFLSDALRVGFKSENFALQILCVGVFVFSIMIPLFASLIISTKASWKYQELYKFRAEINDQRNKFHMKLFWDSVRSKDYEEAKRLYNIKGFIDGSERVLCNGILMGIATQLPIDNDWNPKVDERMKSYL